VLWQLRSITEMKIILKSWLRTEKTYIIIKNSIFFIVKILIVSFQFVDE